MRIATLPLVALLIAAAPPPLPAPIAGHWLTEGGRAVVEIGPCGGQLCGRIARILRPRPGPAVDANNPDPRLRTRPLANLVFLTGFVAGEDRWRGRIYDPESGRTYRSELRRTGGVLEVRGCLGPFCRSQRWSPVAS